jgi:hypothetical protein
MLHQSPTHFGLSTSRWTLHSIGEACSWLSHYTQSGLWRMLRAFRIHYKRGQQHVHSPDPDYVGKRELAKRCVQAADEHPGEVVTLYLDEFSYYRWPTVAPVYHTAGGKQPQAHLTPGYNTRGRVIAALEVRDGKVLYRQRSHITVPQLVGFMKDIRCAYPYAGAINVIQDNWHHVHFHPDQVAMAKSLRINLVPLPVYAPWLNPIEKLGRKLRQDILHMHRQSDDWPTLKKRVAGFFDQFANGSNDLLRYVGLCPDQ